MGTRIKCKGSLDFSQNECSVVRDAQDPRKFSIQPKLGEWEAVNFSKGQQGRHLEFCVPTGSASSAEDWLEALQAHVDYGALRRSIASVDRLMSCASDA